MEVRLRKIYTRNRIATAIGLFISLIGFFLIAIALYRVFYTAIYPYYPFAKHFRPLVYTCAQIIGFVLLVYIVRKEGLSFRESVLYGDFTLKDLGYAMLFLFIAWMLWGFIDRLGAALGIPGYNWMERLGLSVHEPIGFATVAIWCLLAAFFEECFFRGYALGRLYALTNSLWLSSAITILAFTAIHIYFGLRVMMCIAVWSTIITFLVIWRGTLYASIVFHAMNNALAYLLLPQLLQP